MENQSVDLIEEFKRAEEENRLPERMVEELRITENLMKLWEWKKFFYRIPEEEYEKSATLAAGMCQICVMEGKLKEAERYLEMTKSDPYAYAYTKLVMPSMTNKEFRKHLKKMQDDKVALNSHMIMMMGRPSLLNGFRDFTPYANALKEFKGSIVKAIESLYGEAAMGVYEIALAESMYWRDECFDALVLLVGTMPLMEEKKDLRSLFVALSLEMKILVMNGQATSALVMMEKLRKRIEKHDNHGLDHNMDALEVFAAMYDGNTEIINRWIENSAPDEYGDFNMSDTYRYIIKMRCYMIQNKHMALVGMAGRLLPVLEKGYRYMDMCEVKSLMALSCHDQGKKELALQLIGEVLEISEKYRYDRLLGDEGDRMYRLLYDYRKAYGNTPYLKRVMELARRVGLSHPHYLRTQYTEIENLSKMEINVLKLMAEEKSNNDIAAYLDITINTVKFHSKNIFKKLSVQSRGQAVKKAREYGVL